MDNNQLSNNNQEMNHQVTPIQEVNVEASVNNSNTFSNLETIYYLKNYFIVFIVSILCSTPIIRYFIQKLNQNKMIHKIFEIVEPIIYISLLLLCTSYIIDESYNPFLYFRF